MATLAAVAVTVGLAVSTTSCGGGGTTAHNMVLLKFLFVDRALDPTQPTGTQNLPRNGQILMVFSELVDAGSVDQQTIPLRFGPQFQSVPTGSFSVDGPTVRFDPTVTALGEPNPLGFEPVTQYVLNIPSIEEQGDVVRNVDNDPILTTFSTSFSTSDGYLRELTPPEVVRCYSIPDPDPVTGQIPGNGSLAFEFSEPMQPATFVQGGPLGSEAAPECPDNYCIDVRFDDDTQLNKDNGLSTFISDCNGLAAGGTVNSFVGATVPGSFTHNAAATIFQFHPAFSFGDKKYVVVADVKQCLTDLAGNLLINPRSFGFTCDGKGRKTGKMLEETFEDTQNVDFAQTDADWGTTEVKILKGQPITSRQAYIFSYQFVPDPSLPGNAGVTDKWGQYGAMADPLIGEALNQGVPNVNPPTSEGRRVMWAFDENEIGAEGTITAAAWGPDSNATFAASYPSVILRLGYQKQGSLSLSPSFSGNYSGSPTVVYQGTYNVSQKLNVGNTPGHPTFTLPHNPDPYQIGAGCLPNPSQLDPLFLYTGFTAWPKFTNNFDWELTSNDDVLIFDASVAGGDTWQQIRGWFAVTYPCSLVLQGGFPTRRMYSTYENDDPNPATNFTANIVNPEGSVSDTCFTVSRVVSVAQTLFYTDGTQPSDSLQQTFGVKSNYLPILLTPAVQTGGAKIKVEYNAAQAVLADRVTINQALPALLDVNLNPLWVEDLDQCDGFRCIRWRIRLISNLINSQVARLSRVQLPVLDDF